MHWITTENGKNTRVLHWIIREIRAIEFCTELYKKIEKILKLCSTWISVFSGSLIANTAAMFNASVMFSSALGKF